MTGGGIIFRAGRAHGELATTMMLIDETEVDTAGLGDIRDQRRET